MPGRPLATALSLSLAATLAGPMPSLAFADKPTAAVTASAKAHFKQGRAHQQAGSFDAAIGEYLEAYGLAPRPELLFNIAQCHRLAGHAEPAIEFYRRYLADAPEGAAADESRTHVASLQQQLDAERTERAPPAAPSSSAPAPGSVPAPAPPDRDLDLTARPGAAPGRKSGWLGAVGVASVVTGAALIGTGAYLGSRAADEADALATSSEWNPALDAREEAAQLDARRMWYLVGGGSVLLLGGGALWWWSDRPAAAFAAPDVSSDRAGIVVRGAF